MLDLLVPFTSQNMIALKATKRRVQVLNDAVDLGEEESQLRKVALALLGLQLLLMFYLLKVRRRGPASSGTAMK